MTADLLDTPYPTTRPAEVPPDLQRVWRCNFCATGHHGSCPGAVRNAQPGGKLVKCYCCERSPYCIDCRATEQIDPSTWSCTDKLSCNLRVAERLATSPLHQQLQECRSDSAERARRIRLQTEVIRMGLDPDEIDEFERPQEKKLRVPRSTTGACECCGEPTRGGRFLPGHDARLASRLVARIKDGDLQAQEEMVNRGWEGKIPAKLR
jgi:hypothetical protein